MVDHVMLLVRFLRERGATVSTPEVLDAVAALNVAPSYDPATIRTVLRACLIKDKEFAQLFDSAFDCTFEPQHATEGDSAETAVVPEQAAAGSLAVGRGKGGGEEGQSGEGRTAGLSAAQSGAVAYQAGESGLLNLPFLASRPNQKNQLLAIIRELAKKLASKSGSRHQRGKGRVDFRRLWRNSLAAGGIPLELTWRERRKNKPRVFIICDLSNSMYAYLPFFLQFVFSFAATRGTVRVFGFVDSLEEITSLIDPADMSKSLETVSAKARVVRRGLTDYGNAFRGFYRYHREEMTKRTFLVIVGDARNNNFRSGVEYLQEFRARSGGIYWLNPEDKSSWGTGDSYMDVYLPCCDTAFPCENITQLKKFADSFAVK